MRKKGYSGQNSKNRRQCFMMLRISHFEFVNKIFELETLHRDVEPYNCFQNSGTQQKTALENFENNDFSMR